jgi:hypothetical protein
MKVKSNSAEGTFATTSKCNFSTRLHASERPGVEQSAFMFHVFNHFMSQHQTLPLFSAVTCARVLQFIGVCAVVLYQYLE